MNQLAEQLKGEVTNLYASLGHIYKDLPEFESKIAEDELNHQLSQIPAPQMNEIIGSLNFYNNIISEGLDSYEIIDDLHKNHLDSFLQKLNLTISDEIYKYLDEDVIVEIYSKEHRQLYRSVNFFKLSRYDFYTLTFVPWENLYYRAPAIKGKIFNSINQAIHSGTFFKPETGIPDHIITEVETGRKLKYESICGGVVRDGEEEQPMGYIGLIKIKPITTKLQSV